MTRTEKRRFLEEHFASCLQSLLEKVADMPEKWDGMELREQAAEIFHDSCYLRFDKNTKRQRYLNYKNEANVRNL